MPESQAPATTSAVTSCPACGGTVAYGAKTCPHCGKAKPAPKPPTKVTKTHLVLAALLLVGMFAIQSNEKRGPTADQVVKQGLGITTAIGIGGDPIIGTTTKMAVELLMNDPETNCIVMIGEIGGQLEADAAYWIKADGNRKPVIGFIAGETAPKGRTMGHAGAIVGGADDTAEAKKRIMRECGIYVVDSPAEIGKKVKEVLG